MPSYINTDVVTSVIKTLSATVTNNKYDAIALISGIPHSSQLEVYRLFTMDRNGNAVSTTGWTPADQKRAYVMPNFKADNVTARVVYDETNKQITSISTDVYDFTLSSGVVLAVPPIAIGSSITIRRKTYSASPLISWSVGNKISSSQLNLQTNQLLYLIQELNDRLLNTQSITVTGGTNALTSDTALTVSNLAITPTKLSTGGPTWDASSNLTIGASGNLSLNGNFTIDTSAPKFTVTKTSGDTVIAGALTLGGVATFSNLTASLPVVTNASKVLTSATVTGSGTTIVMSGAPTLTGTTSVAALTSTGLGTFQAGLTISGAATTLTNGNLIVSSGNIQATAGTLSIAGNSTLSGTLIVGGATTINSGGLTITAGGQTITAGNFTLTAGTQTISAGSLSVTAGLISATANYVTSGSTTAGNLQPTDNNHVARKDYVDSIGRIGKSYDFIIQSAATPVVFGHKPSSITLTGTATTQTATITSGTGTNFIGYYQILGATGIPTAAPVSFTRNPASAGTIAALTTVSSGFVHYSLTRTA